VNALGRKPCAASLASALCAGSLVRLVSGPFICQLVTELPPLACPIEAVSAALAVIDVVAAGRVAGFGVDL